MIHWVQIALDVPLLLCLRGILAVLKVERVAEDHTAPEEPQRDPQAADQRVKKRRALDLAPSEPLAPANQDDQHQAGQEERPTVIARQSRQEGGDSHRNQVAQSVFLRPYHQVIARGRHRRQQHHFRKRCGLQIEDVGIDQKGERTDETGQTVAGQPPRRQIEIDGGDDIANHRREASRQPCAPQRVIPDQRQHDHVGQRQPNATQLGEAGRIVVEDPPRDIQVRMRVVIEQGVVVVIEIDQVADADRCRHEERHPHPRIVQPATAQFRRSQALHIDDFFGRDVRDGHDAGGFDIGAHGAPLLALADGAHLAGGKGERLSTLSLAFEM
jgi:hypothetical protein